MDIIGTKTYLSLLELLQKLQYLNKKQQALKSKLDYKDLYLEQARANYELDIKSDIGDSMVEYTKTELEIAQNEFKYFLIWQELSKISGDIL